MQKIWFGLFGIIITTGTFAADLCVKNDAMVVAMNPYINATSATYTSAYAGKTWTGNFSYGKLSGIAGCYTTGAASVGAPSQAPITINTTGEYCYCKMLRPTLSPWLYAGYNVHSSPCVNACQQSCSEFISRESSWRRALFRAINDID